MWCVLAKCSWQCTVRWFTTVGIHLTNFTHPVFEWLWQKKSPKIFVVFRWAITTFIVYHPFYQTRLGWFSLLLTRMILHYVVVYSSICHHLLFDLHCFLLSELNWLVLLNGLEHSLVCSVVIHFQQFSSHRNLVSYKNFINNYINPKLNTIYTN